MANKEVFHNNGSDMHAARILKERGMLWYGADSMSIGAALYGYIAHQLPVNYQVDVTPWPIEDRKFKVEVTVQNGLVNGDGRIYKRSAIIENEPANLYVLKGELIIPTAQENDGEVNQIIDQALLNPNQSIEHYFSEMFKKDGLVIETVATKLSAYHAEMLVYRKPIFSTNGHGK